MIRLTDSQLATVMQLAHPLALGGTVTPQATRRPSRDVPGQ